MAEQSRVILRRKQVEARTGLSRSSIYAAIAEGTFPRPIKLSARAVGWDSVAIDEWIEDRIRQSREVA